VSTLRPAGENTMNQDTKHDPAAPIPIPNLKQTTLTKLLGVDLAAGHLTHTIAAIRQQLGRPRSNLGGAGPPGRAD
jgi:hypothetical protein